MSCECDSCEKSGSDVKLCQTKSGQWAYLCKKCRSKNREFREVKKQGNTGNR